MIRVAIVDDDPAYVRELEYLLGLYQTESGTKMKIRTFSDGDEIASEYRAEWDIILLDVEMQFMDGISAAERIRKLDPEVLIIFITNMAQHAIRGYAVDALDYVLKPINGYALSQRIDRALDRLKRAPRQSIQIKWRGDVHKVDTADILYVEVQNHDLMVHTAQRTFTVPGALKDFEETLASETFFRCNKGYLVNLDAVEGVEGDEALVDGDRLPISRARKKAFLDRMNNYLSGGRP